MFQKPEQPLVSVISVVSEDGSVQGIDQNSPSIPTTAGTVFVKKSPLLHESSMSPQVGRKRKHPQKPGKYICSYCGRGCAKPSVLEKHIRAHTGERPYPCVPCGFSFKTKSNLYKHCKSRSHALRVAGEGGDTNPGKSIEEDNESGESSVVGILLPPKSSVEEEKDKEGKKKELKYYIVEVKEGDSLEEVVKKARLAAGTDKIETITQSTQRPKIEVHTAENATTESRNMQQMEPEVINVCATPDSGRTADDWQMIEEVPVEASSIKEQALTGPSAESANGTTVKLEFQLGSATSDMQRLNRSVSELQLSSNLSASVSQPTTIMSSVTETIQETVYQTSPLMSIPDQGSKRKLISSPLSLQFHPTATLQKLKAPQGKPMLTPDMLTARISELITKNQAIVNTPMADAPRPKRASRQASESLSRSASLASNSQTPSIGQQQTIDNNRLFIQGEYIILHTYVFVLAFPSEPVTEY